MPITYGTSYFVTRSAANRYYAEYGESAERVARKLLNGEIHIGKPPLKPGQTLSLVDGGRRWAITEPSNLAPAQAGVIGEK